jgi:putative transposase
MLAGRRFRVEFSDEQEAFAAQIGAACRAVWNTGLEHRREYRRRGAWMNYQPQAHELAEAKPEHPWLTSVPGVVVAVATSDGELIDREFSTVSERRRAVVLQRKLSRAGTGSVNRGKVRAELAKLRAAERHRREDFCAKTAHRLAHTSAAVVLEDLNTRSMTRRAKPVEDPDNAGQFLANGAASKSGLNRAILGKGWHRFEESLRSVSRYTGTQVIKVPAAFTSLRCSVCGHVDPKSRESQAGFRCTSCSRRQHADVNAAKNVLAAGLAVTACREAAPPAGGATTSTQEPAGNREELLLQPV